MVVALCDMKLLLRSSRKTLCPHLAGPTYGVHCNNDGCVVIRSPEAQGLEITMDDPWLQLADDAQRGG